MKPRFFSLNNVYGDKDLAIAPARVVNISKKNGGAVFIRLYLPSDINVNSLKRQDEANGYLIDYKDKDVNIGDMLLIECEGKIIKYFIEKGIMPQNNWGNRCTYRGIMEKEEYDKLVSNLDGEKISKLLEQFNDLENKNKELEEEKNKKLSQIKDINTFENLQVEIKELETKKSEKEEEMTEWDEIIEEYAWAKPIKHHFEKEDTNTIDFSKEKTMKLKEKLKKEIKRQLTSNLGLNEDFANCYLFSLLTALLNGRFLLLTGHIGTGKSHLIKQSGTLFGGETDMVAVRPAWLDSSDLLGYFDPLNNKYHATDFVRYLSKKNNNRLHMILLDEMNIARIENYGADILANLSPIINNQRQEQSNQIKLYPTDMQEMLFLHKLYHETKDTLSEEKQKEFNQLLQQYQDKEKPAINIEDNVLICGTLNIDGSTENLSPKMIDRSLILKFPDFDGQFAILQKIEEIELPINALKNHIEKKAPDIDKWKYFYEKIEDMQELLLPISRRVAEDYLLFHRINEYFGIIDETKKDNENKINNYFIYSRILPRLRIEQFDNDVKKLLQNKLQDDLFKAFLDEITKLDDGEFIDYQHICG